MTIDLVIEVDAEHPYVMREKLSEAGTYNSTTLATSDFRIVRSRSGTPVRVYNGGEIMAVSQARREAPKNVRGSIDTSWPAVIKVEGRYYPFAEGDRVEK